MNYIGLIIGLATFLCIGIFHPIVIKAEYYFGRRCWWAFLLAGIGCIGASLVVDNDYASIILGVIAFSALWGIHELRQQHRRVQRGWFPMNPRRRHDYES
ncbi:MAG: DUF4491 family protein [Bacteroidaceae bacterium]|nr:DUF4491 family protein [Bacteroidaceae bacterium]